MDHVIESHVYSYITIGGSKIPFITDAVITMFIVTVALTVLIIICGRKLTLVPTGAQNAAEIFLDFINGFAKTQIGHNYKPFVPFAASLIMFISFSNIIGLFNIIPSGSFLAWVFNNDALSSFSFSLHPPTKNINVTACLAVITILFVLFAEIKYKGFKGWLVSFIKPTPISGVIKIMDFFIRPVSLCFRLFGNILAASIIMTLAYSAIPAIFPAIVGLYFDLFDGFLHGYIFVFLTLVYLGEAVEIEEHA